MSRYRHEYKYRIGQMEEEILRLKAEGILGRDPHAALNGSYLVRNLYFDDREDSGIFECESGTDLRSKFRIRYYNDDRTYIRLEKKSKLRGMVQKEACSLSPGECSLLMQGIVPEAAPGLPREKQKLLLEMRLRSLIPKLIVSYERIPFVYPAGNVRITFDKGVTSSSDMDRFLTGDYSVRPVMQPGCSILEVKWDELLPPHIKEVMQLESLQWTSFSKYYMCSTCRM